MARQARYELQRAADGIPSGIPSPDGAAHIRVAANWERTARKAYQVAMNRFYDFILSGTIPEDLDTSSGHE
jgi:hypothetical protein